MKLYPYLLASFCLQYAGGFAQPFIDLLAVRYQHSPQTGIFRQGYHPAGIQYGSAAANLPLLFKKDSSLLVLSPAAEQWHISSTARVQFPSRLSGMALPVAYVKPLNQKWTSTVTLISRWNGADNVRFNNRLQVGGAVILTHKQSEQRKYKFGLYYNKEFFGHFVMPLAGIDWKINPRLHVFGVLPGSMTLERKVSRSFCYGLTFRATTTSYRFSNTTAPQRRFVRIDENQLNLFADFYLTKKMVLNAETGHSLFRRLRLGAEGSGSKYFFKEKFNDGLLWRLMLAYRLRFDEAF